jgi:nondiscriminating aspartyl-tRNA synthetase
MPGHEGFTNSFDVLFKGQELITGGQRLHLYADYVEAIERRGEDIATYESYLQAFKYGMPPHGGFAIGLERFVGGIAGTKNIRESTLFPRDLNRLRP